MPCICSKAVGYGNNQVTSMLTHAETLYVLDLRVSADIRGVLEIDINQSVKESENRPGVTFGLRLRRSQLLSTWNVV